MGLKVSERASHVPNSRGLDALAREIRENLPILVRVDVRHRAGLRGGRTYKRPTFAFEVEEESERDEEIVFDGVMEKALDLEADEGCPCFFVADVVVQPPGESVQVSRSIPFRIDGTDDPENEHNQIIGGLTRTANMQDKMIGRLLSRLDALTESQVRQATALAELKRSDAETMRVKYEHEDRMAERASEDARAESEHELIRELGLPFLALQAAKEARKDITQQDGKRMAAWRRLRQMAQIIQHREAAREAFGEEGIDLVEAIADAKKRDDVEGAFAELRQRMQSGEIKFWEVLRVCPELVAFADMFVGAPQGQSAAE